MIDYAFQYPTANNLLALAGAVPTPTNIAVISFL